MKPQDRHDLMMSAELLRRHVEHFLTEPTLANKCICDDAMASHVQLHQGIVGHFFFLPKGAHNGRTKHYR